MNGPGQTFEDERLTAKVLLLQELVEESIGAVGELNFTRLDQLSGELDVVLNSIGADSARSSAPTSNLVSISKRLKNSSQIYSRVLASSVKTLTALHGAAASTAVDCSSSAGDEPPPNGFLPRGA